ncbi:MAG TPA: 3-deoxy-D-manno-octulosonic acid transferase [Vicinamibacterales bacterium]|nr:3-deoxy-D-manno-octulosonic acid transferase [Vicinamibacterales bacterium]
MYFLYSVATLLALVVLSPYLLYQALRYNKYVGSLGQRLGYLPVSFNLDAEESIWVHAVSVGEVLAARPIVSGLRARYPELRIFLSTTTLSGQNVARRRVPDADAVFYLPLDWTFTIRRTLDVVKPKLFVMVETEIWPNLLRECRRRGIRTALVNGRISSRSFPRYRLVRPFIRRVLADIDRLCVQSEETARRLRQLGADPSRITLTGSLKFDSLDPSTAPGRGRERVLRFFRVAPSRLVLVAGSTSKGEEEAVIRAFNRVRTTATPGSPLLILAARHPERFGEVEKLCQREGLSTIRRSDLPIDKEPRADAVILDTIGELAQLYQIATAVFVGGSLVPLGGHNILEPAVHGKPIVFGPHMENFAEIAGAFLANGAAVEVRTARELEDVVVELMADPVRRARLGAAARALVDANRGAKDTTLKVLVDLVPPREPRSVVRPFRVIH